jgi:lactoylglutathione lyase
MVGVNLGERADTSFGHLRRCARRGVGYPRRMRVRKLLHTRYRVNDLERSVQFYKQVLGLEEVRRHKSPRGSELVFLKAPESEETIELCCFPASGPVQVQPDLTHLAFEVDSLEAFGRHLASLGLKYSDGPTLRPDGSGGFAFIDAPEGYEIELIQRSAQASRAETY